MTALAYGPRLARRAAATRRSASAALAPAARSSSPPPGVEALASLRAGAAVLVAAVARRSPRRRGARHAGAAGRAHRPLPRHRPGRRHPHPGRRRRRRPVRRRPAGGARLPAAAAQRACAGSTSMVATHQSRDHHGGLHEVLDRIPTSLLLENSDGTTDRDFRRLLAEADARGIRASRRAPGRCFASAASRSRSCRRAAAARRPAPEDPNPRGVAAIVSAGDFDLWLSADAETDAHPAAPSAPGRGDEGLPPRQRRPRPARGARAPAARRWRRSRSAPTTPTATRRPRRSPPCEPRSRTSTAPTVTGR